MNKTQRRPRDQRGYRDRPDRVLLVLDHHQARELLALLEDDEGDADEDLLDQVIAVLDTAEVHPRPQERRRLDDKRAISVRVSPVEKEYLIAFVLDDRDPGVRLDDLTRRLRVALS